MGLNPSARSLLDELGRCGRAWRRSSSCGVRRPVRPCRGGAGGSGGRRARPRLPGRQRPALYRLDLHRRCRPGRARSVVQRSRPLRPWRLRLAVARERRVAAAAAGLDAMERNRPRADQYRMRWCWRPPDSSLTVSCAQAIASRMRIQIVRRQAVSPLLFGQVKAARKRVVLSCEVASNVGLDGVGRSAERAGAGCARRCAPRREDPRRPG